MRAGILEAYAARFARLHLTLQMDRPDMAHQIPPVHHFDRTVRTGVPLLLRMGEHVRRDVRNHGAARATKLLLFLVRRIGFMVPAHVHVVRSQMRKPFRTRFTAVLTRSVL